MHHIEESRLSVIVHLRFMLLPVNVFLTVAIECHLVSSNDTRLFISIVSRMPRGQEVSMGFWKVCKSTALTPVRQRGPRCQLLC